MRAMEVEAGEAVSPVGEEGGMAAGGDSNPCPECHASALTCTGHSIPTVSLVTDAGESLGIANTGSIIRAVVNASKTIVYSCTK